MPSVANLGFPTSLLEKTHATQNKKKGGNMKKFFALVVLSLCMAPHHSEPMSSGILSRSPVRTRTKPRKSRSRKLAMQERRS